MDNFLNLNGQNVLGDGAEKLSEDAQNMQNQLNRLLSDTEGVTEALDGDSGRKFLGAAGELHDRFHELMQWCSRTGLRFSDAQESVTLAETSSSEILEKSYQNMGALQRNINA